MAKNLEVGPREYWSALRRRKWLIAVSVVAWVAPAFGLNAVTDPVYRAKTQVVIEKEPTRSMLTGELLETSTSQSDNLALFTAAALIDNRALLAEVVETLTARGAMLADSSQQESAAPLPLGTEEARRQLSRRGGRACGAEAPHRLARIEDQRGAGPRNTRLVNIYV